MSDFFTNAYQSKNSLLICGYRNGKRFKERIHYKPYLFVPTQGEAEWKSIHGEPLGRVDFDSIADAKQFIKKYDGVENFEVHGLDKFVHTYLNDEYPGEIDYDQSLIKVWNIDIETGKTDQKKFAEPEFANGPITCIGIGIGKDRIALSTKYYSGEKKIKYILCEHEEDLLRKFLDLVSDEEMRPDVFTGWNIENYDIPFIVNRIKRILGNDQAKRISPWGILSERTVQNHGKEMITYIPVGVSVLDYYAIYRKFTQNQQESYTLDHIAFVETKKRKLDYSEYESLDELFEKDFNKFIDYNITDIDRVADIDERKKLLNIVYAMSYDAKVNFNDSLGSVHYWDIAIHNELADEKIAVPPYSKEKERNVVGGFVKDPQIGIHQWPVSFDFTSLYPFLQICYNISPEKLVGFENWSIEKVDEILNKEQLVEGDDSVSTCANGARFKRDSLGILPKLLLKQYNKRKEYKKKMFEVEKEFERTKDKKLEKEIDRYYNAQWTKKIQLNSLFGALANRGFRYYNPVLAEAITSTGQLSSRWIAKKFNQFLNKTLKTKDLDYVIAIDTDSVIVAMDRVVKTCCKPDASKEHIISFLDRLSKEKIQPQINKWCEEITGIMNAYQNALNMKREIIADKAIWVAKKRYIMNVWDKEEVRYSEPELKMMGIEAVRSSTPAVCKDAIKEALRIIMAKDESDVVEFIDNFRQQFEQMDFDKVAFPRGVNGLEEYHDSISLFKKATPIHVRGSLVYNDLLKKNGLDDKYPLIQSKDKIKFCYLRVPNIARSNVIAAPKILPKQLGLDKYIDYDTQFQKTFLDPIKNILNVIGWKTEYTPSLEGLF